MNDVFKWVEGTALSEWVNGTAFLSILTVHTLAIGLFAALLIVQSALKWAAPQADIATQNVRQIYWVAFAISLISGLLLLWGYPYKALTNWVFYAKLGALCIAMFALNGGLRIASIRAAQRLWLGVAVIAICGVVAGGRLLGYTYISLIAP